MLKRELVILASVCTLLALYHPIDAISDADKQTVLEEHNYYRANVGLWFPPPATPLPNLVWDDDLAAVAQNYADTCTSYHNNERTNQYQQRTGGTDAVGENIAAQACTGCASPPALPVATIFWYNEKNQWTYSPNNWGTCSGNGVCGHWTQVIWETTTRVGCGVTYACTSLAGQSIPAGAKITHIVCNYAPAGNWNVDTTPAYIQAPPQAPTPVQAQAPTPVQTQAPTPVQTQAPTPVQTQAPTPVQTQPPQTQSTPTPSPQTQPAPVTTIPTDVDLSPDGAAGAPVPTSSASTLSPLILLVASLLVVCWF